MNQTVINCSKLTPSLLEVLSRMVSQFDQYRIHIATVESESELPLPWDAWVEIKVFAGIPTLVIEGAAGPSGFGYCNVSVPLEEAEGYQIVIECLGTAAIPVELTKHVVVF